MKIPPSVQIARISQVFPSKVTIGPGRRKNADTDSSTNNYRQAETQAEYAQ